MSLAQCPSEDPLNCEDLTLVAAVLRKDRKATAEFVNRFADPLVGYLHSRLSPRNDLVEDMVQEVFLAAWEPCPRSKAVHRW